MNSSHRWQRIITISILIVIFATCFLLVGCQQGVAGGKSAYQIAVDNGFVGTEKQWLESLKGDSFDINAVYENYKKENPNASYDDFLKEFMTINEQENIQYATNIAFKSVVNIFAQFTIVKTPIWGGEPTTKEVTAAGAGVIYKLAADAEGNRTGGAFLITNYHVIYEKTSSEDGISQKIYIMPYGRGYNSNYPEYGKPDIMATFVGGSLENDIAVLYVEDDYFKTDKIQAVAIGNSDEICAGDAVVAVGNPNGSGISATSGIISVDSEQIDMPLLSDQSKKNPMRVIRIDAAVNGGNSGGGLFNTNGELLGIVNAKIEKVGIDNIAYAIPSVIASRIADKIIAKDTNKMLLGITTTITQSQAVFDVASGKSHIVEQIIVADVLKDSVSIDKIKKGDIILTAQLKNSNGEAVVPMITISRNFYLSNLMWKASNNDILTLTVLRDGKEVSVDIKISDKYCVSIK